MKILVTGGAGFIGSHIVDKYIGLGHKVVVIDNLSTGFKKNLNKRAKFYKVDIRNYKEIQKIIKKEKPQIINHHAAISGVPQSIKDPISTYQINVLGTVNLLLAAGESKVKKFVFVSSAGTIYGDAKKLPVRENFPLNPLSPYALSKCVGEELVEFYAKAYGFNYLILRCGNVYGPRQNPKAEAGVVAIFAGLMKKNVRPTIFGNGTKTRDYTYIDDVVGVNVIGLKKGKNNFFNIGSGKEISDRKIFDTLANKLNFQKPPIYAPFRPGELYRIYLDCSRAKRLLGWKSSINFEQGIKEYLNNL